MVKSLALHTAARRYCAERFSHWCNRYAEICRSGHDRQRDGYHYTNEALATFPRYNVAEAIHLEVERLDSAKLGALEETRDLLILAGQVATTEVTRKPIGEIDAQAMAEERDAFCRYIRELSVVDLDAVEELPYRRVLTDEEGQLIWARVRSRWGISDNYWYPLAECGLSDIAAFKTASFEEAIGPVGVRQLLANHQIDRVWELREFGPEFEVATTLMEPYYDGAEGYWTSTDLAWIIYASHEGSVTIGGWLLNELKAMWRSWNAHLWAMS